MRLPSAVLATLFALLIALALTAQEDATDTKGRSLARRPKATSTVPTANPTSTPTPTGFSITPTAAPGAVFTPMNPNLPGLSTYNAGQPMTTSVSPDGRTMLVLTSGYNLLNGSDGSNLAAAGNEYVFVYDISSNKLNQLGAVPLPAAYAGIAWNPSGKEFYVSGGAGDLVFVITAGATGFGLGATIPMGHVNTTGFGSGLGLGQPSIVAGMSVNSSGTRLLVANMENDSVTLVDIPNRKVITELDLRPDTTNSSGAVIAGGEFPFWTVIKGNNKAYVSSMRDREIDVLSLTNDRLAVTKRIPVQGNPNKMILDKAQARLIAAEDNADAAVVIDTNLDIVLDTIPTTAPPKATPFTKTS